MLWTIVGAPVGHDVAIYTPNAANSRPQNNGKHKLCVRAK